ncbi:hypothetical protein YC2023_013298 [Brassica napus]
MSDVLREIKKLVWKFLLHQVARVLGATWERHHIEKCFGSREASPQVTVRFALSAGHSQNTGKEDEMVDAETQKTVAGDRECTRYRTS